jgi:hypothetical protein
MCPNYKKTMRAVIIIYACSRFFASVCAEGNLILANDT